MTLRILTMAALALSLTLTGAPSLGAQEVVEADKEHQIVDEISGPVESVNDQSRTFGLDGLVLNVPDAIEDYEELTVGDEVIVSYYVENGSKIVEELVVVEEN